MHLFKDYSVYLLVGPGTGVLVAGIGILVAGVVAIDAVSIKNDRLVI